MNSKILVLNAGKGVVNRTECVPGAAQKECVAVLGGEAMGVMEAWVFLHTTPVLATKIRN